jgi:hypothetical protein
MIVMNEVYLARSAPILLSLAHIFAALLASSLVYATAMYCASRLDLPSAALTVPIAFFFCVWTACDVARRTAGCLLPWSLFLTTIVMIFVAIFLQWAPRPDTEHIFLVALSSVLCILSMVVTCAASCLLYFSQAGACGPFLAIPLVHTAAVLLPHTAALVCAGLGAAACLLLSFAICREGPVGARDVPATSSVLSLFSAALLFATLFACQPAWGPLLNAFCLTAAAGLVFGDSLGVRCHPCVLFVAACIYAYIYIVLFEIGALTWVGLVTLMCLGGFSLGLLTALLWMSADTSLLPSAAFVGCAVGFGARLSHTYFYAIKI